MTGKELYQKLRLGDFSLRLDGENVEILQASWADWEGHPENEILYLEYVGPEEEEYTIFREEEFNDAKIEDGIAQVPDPDDEIPEGYSFLFSSDS